MTGALFVRCPICRELLPVPADVIGTDGHLVIARIDRSDLYGHTQACAGTAPVPTKDVEKMANSQISRACTMCGTNGAVCLDGLKRTRKSCCGVCGDGNTHPEPGEAVGSCQQWAADKLGFQRKAATA